MKSGLNVTSLEFLLWRKGEHNTGIILGVGSANERLRYNVTSVIGWAHTQNDPCNTIFIIHRQIHIDGLVQDSSISIVLAMEILQSSTK